MESILLQQRAYFLDNKSKPLSRRLNVLSHLKMVIENHQEQLQNAILEDFGKSHYESYMTEIGMIYQEIDRAIKKLPKWARIKKVPNNMVNFPGKSYIMPEPLGNTLVIGAWNYPIQLALIPCVAALAAGNTVILKPSELPSKTAAVIEQMINENFDPAIMHVINGDVSVTTELLQHKFDKIFFTGSTKVGQIVYEAAAKHLTPVTLELGGKSPVIIDEDVDLEIAVKRIVWAKFINAGQTCVAPDYIYVHEKVAGRFINLVTSFIKKQEYSVENRNYVQIINDKNFDRLTQLIDKDKILYGGKSDKATRVVHPTVLYPVTWADAVMQEEIFGPIMPIMTYTDLNDILPIIKSKDKPLALYLFTNRAVVKNEVLRHISFGGGCINDTMMHLSNPNLPFGGVGTSGMGSYHGKYGFDTFSHFKSVLDKSTIFEPNIKYAPYTPIKEKIVQKLM